MRLEQQLKNYLITRQMEQTAIQASRTEIERLIVAVQTQAVQAQTPTQPVTHQEPFTVPPPHSVTILCPADQTGT